MDIGIIHLARAVLAEPKDWPTSTAVLLARAIMEDQKTASALKQSSGISCYFCALPATTMAGGFAVCEPHRVPMADTEDIAEPETLADKVLGRNPTSYQFASPEDLAPRPDVLRTSTCKHCEQPVELVDVPGGTPIWNHYTPSRGRWAPCSEELWEIARRGIGPLPLLTTYAARGGTWATPLDDDEAEPTSPPPEPPTAVSGHRSAAQAEALAVDGLLSAWRQLQTWESGYEVGSVPWDTEHLPRFFWTAMERLEQAAER